MTTHTPARNASGPLLAIRSRVPRARRYWTAVMFVVSCAAAFVAAPCALAQSPPATPPSATTPPDDDDATLKPAEPDFRLINLPTTLRLPLHASNFQVTHRFNGNLLDGSF